MSDETTSEQTEQLTNDLIAVIWPLLDKGATRDEIQCAVHNVLDSWEPLEGVVGQAADPFKPYAVYLARSGKHYDLPPEVGDDIVHYTHALLWASEQRLALVNALRKLEAWAAIPDGHPAQPLRDQARHALKVAEKGMP